MPKSIHEEQTIQSHFDLPLMKRLLGYAKPNFGILILSIILMLFVTAVDLSVPYFTKTAIDDFIKPVEINLVQPETEKPLTLDAQTFESAVIAGDYTLSLPVFNRDDTIITLSLPTEDAEGTYTAYLDDHINFTFKPSSSTFEEALKTMRSAALTKLILILMGILILNLFFAFAHTYFLNYASQRIVYDLRDALFAHIQAMSLHFFDENPVGRLVTRVSNDMNNIKEMFTDVLVTSLKDFFLLGGTVIVMMSINAKLAIYCFATMPLVLFAAHIFREKARAVQREVKIKLARINATLAENINGMKIIQIFNQEEEVYNAFDDINYDYLTSNFKQTKVYAIFRPMMNLAYSISLGLLIWFGSGDALSGKVELGVLIAFISYTQQFFRPIMDLSEKFNIFQSSMASAERIFYLLDTEDVIENSDTPTPLDDKNFVGKITFKNVWFSYLDNPKQEKDYVLKNISFTIEPGTSVAFVGATGSGKTTIISLINRFYDIQKGEILIDDIPIQMIHKDVLRQKIGMVLQDVFLFSGNIKENIRLEHEDITDEQVIEVSKYVNAHTFISELTHSYNEHVVERGATLSSGQRQLLSFARALVYNPKILILDEATSNIDTETELLIQEAIGRMIKHRTTLIVAHRLSTIQHADQIIVMHKGEIKERGKHQELLNMGGRYFDLYKLQYQEM